MKRRGVLGLLVGGLAAAPSMAKQAISGIEATQLPGLSTGGGLVSATDSPWSGGYPLVGTGIEYDHLGWLKGRLEEITGISDAERHERIANQYISSLDPDLAVNRSMALWAKMAEQRRREYERGIERERMSLTRQISDFIRDQAFKK